MYYVPLVHCVLNAFLYIEAGLFNTFTWVICIA